MPRLKGSADRLEDRRKHALALLDSGGSLNEVGRRIGCNPSSVVEQQQLKGVLAHFRWRLDEFAMLEL
jgi:hypothetical protein